jgi:hypothetical protein
MEIKLFEFARVFLENFSYKPKENKLNYFFARAVNHKIGFPRGPYKTKGDGGGFAYSR